MSIAHRVVARHQPKFAMTQAMTLRVAARYASRPKLVVHKKPSKVVDVNLVAAGEDVGYVFLKASRPTKDALKSDCASLVDELQVEHFPRKPALLWRVADAHLEPEWRNKGWGMKMYEKALKAARPLVLVTGDCMGWGTTAEAQRVWDALARKYPTKGSGSFRALVVR